MPILNLIEKFLWKAAEKLIFHISYNSSWNIEQSLWCIIKFASLWFLYTRKEEMMKQTMIIVVIDCFVKLHLQV